MLMPADSLTISKSFKGPFLISKEQLISLDEIINYVSDIYQDLLREMIVGPEKISHEEEEQKIETYKSNYVYKPIIKIATQFKSQKVENNYTSIIDLIKELNLSNEEILYIKINIMSSTNTFYLKISGSHSFDDLLALEIKTTYLAAQDIYFKMDQWIDKIRPNSLMLIWSKLNDYLPIYSTLILLFYSFFWLCNNSYKSVYKSEATELLNVGINDDNRDKAIELILKYNADYIPPDFQFDFVSLLWGLSISMLIIISIFFAPKTTFELGKGKSKYRIYKIWIRIATVTIPSMIIIPIIINFITNNF